MGTGGGGEVEWARPLIDEVYSKKKKFRLVDPKEVPDPETVVIVSRIGGGITKEQEKKVEHLPRIKGRLDLLAFNLLSKHLGRNPTRSCPQSWALGTRWPPCTSQRCLTNPRSTLIASGGQNRKSRFPPQASAEFLSLLPVS